MGKKIKVFLILLISVLVIFLAGMIGFLWFKGRSLPITSGKLTITGIEAPVEIIRDSDGIPHIYAENRHDLFFAQGYVHAQDRFWQMEFWRRVGAGRLSELFGPKQLESDIYLRTMGFARVSEKEYNQLEPEYKSYLEAYSEGVNAWILDKKPQKLALEFSLLKLTGVDVKVEPWTPVNSITWAKVMAMDMGGNMSSERLILDVIRTVGLDTMADFFPLEREEMPFIVSEKEYLSFRQKQGLPEIKKEVTNFQISNQFTQGSLSEIGSNSWVISGNLTESGKPILANDMHLGIQMPSIWYEIDLHCTGDRPINVKGYSFAGVPGVISGHNENISWAFANLGVDIQDLYVEKLNKENPDLYLKNDSWIPMDIIYETIKIEGEDEPYVLRVRYTEHGPIISDSGSYSGLRGFTVEQEGIFPDNFNLTALSVKWTALSPGYIFQSIPLLDEAENYSDFREALRFWDVPGMSVVFADKKGNIGYQMTGEIPIRRQGTGTGPMPGWVDDYEWQGFIPYEEMPASLNPEKGYIVTSNNQVINNSYHYYLSSYYSYGYRAKRIIELIEKDPDGISIDDVRKIHGDVFNLTAEETLPHLTDIDFTTVYEEMMEIPEEETKGERKKREKKTDKEIKSINQAFRILQEWDKIQIKESTGAAVYGFFWHKLSELTFKDQFPENRWPPKSINRYENSIVLLLKDQNNSWWDDLKTPEKTETAEDILGKAFVKGIISGIEELGYDVSKWEWGDVHTAEFENATLGKSGIGLIEGLFNRGPFPVDGGASQVNAAAWRFEDPFTVYHIASMRQIIDLSDLNNSLMIHTTGQSGHPASKHYDDFIPLWQNVEYHKNLWDKEDVLKNKEGILKLIPEMD